MKAVLISINPKWCAEIASGEKTIEIRKTAPKIETPFKCYIYCTLPTKEELFTHSGIREYANELIRLQSGEVVYDYGMRLCCDLEGRPYTSDNFLCRKVIGEFICDRITPLFNIATDDWNYLKGDTHEWHKRLVRQACLTELEFKAYAKGKNCFAWHIAKLKVYDKPKPLASLLVVDNEAVKNCTHRERIFTNPDLTNGAFLPGSYLCKDKTDWCTDCKTKAVTRPPQSWCYVEEN